jgi:hypothetical protein
MVSQEISKAPIQKEIDSLDSRVLFPTISKIFDILGSNDGGIITELDCLEYAIQHLTCIQTYFEGKTSPDAIIAHICLNPDLGFCIEYHLGQFFAKAKSLQRYLPMDCQYMKEKEWHHHVRNFIEHDHPILSNVTYPYDNMSEKLGFTERELLIFVTTLELCEHMLPVLMDLKGKLVVPNNEIPKYQDSDDILFI